MSKSNFKIMRVAKDVNPASYDIFDGHNGRVGLFVSREQAKAVVEYLNMKGYTSLREVQDQELRWLRRYGDLIIEEFYKAIQIEMSVASKIFGKNIVG